MGEQPPNPATNPHPLLITTEPTQPDRTGQRCRVCWGFVDPILDKGIPVYYRYLCNCIGSMGFICENCVFSSLAADFGAGCISCQTHYQNINIIRNHSIFARMSFREFIDVYDWKWIPFWSFLFMLPTGSDTILNVFGMDRFERLTLAVSEFIHTFLPFGDAVGSAIYSVVFFLLQILICGSTILLTGFSVHLGIFLLYSIYNWYTTVGPIVGIEILNPNGTLRARIDVQPMAPQLLPPPNAVQNDPLFPDEVVDEDEIVVDFLEDL